MALIKSISGIRGTIGGKLGESLTPIDVVKFASAFGKWVLDTSGNKKMVIGRDARVSGELVSKLIASSLQALGIDVVDLGLSTTPTVEVAVTMEAAGGGIVITASHNPANWNALKLLNNKGEFISAEDGEKVLELAESSAIQFATIGQLGKYTENDSYIDKHIDQILALPLVNVDAITKRNFKIIIDCVNSTGGIAVPRLLKRLGVKTIEPLFVEPNGQFPHNPEPLPENLGIISGKMNAGNFDLGIVVDPDVDRLVLMCEDGTPFGEEYTLVAVADYILANKKGNTVSNMSSTRALRDVTESYGNAYYSSAVGEVNVVEVMKEQNAVIGGEGNGGIIYPELHYGRDALVGIALFLSHLALFGKSAKMLRAKYPTYYMSKNKIELTNEINVDKVLDSIAAKYAKNPISRVDGVKIEFGKEWVHLRKSNTEPIIRIYTESDSLVTAENLAKKMISDIKELISAKVE